jgi:hypothetical protein
MLNYYYMASNFKFELSEGREITTVEDFLEFMGREPQKYSFGYVYYTYPAKMATESKKNPSPFAGRIFKHKPHKFRWAETYKEAMLRKDPDYQFVGGGGEYKPVEGVKLVVEGKNGLYFPIVPLEDATYHTVYTLDWKVVPYEEIAQHLAIPSGNIPPKISMLVERIAGISAGGAFLKNPEFKFKYMGDNAARFQ